MLVGIDGACKHNGTPACISCGVAVILDDADNITWKAITEEESTNQRGELNGLIAALQYAKNVPNQEDNTIVIVTDSEYIFNTVSKEWYEKWYHNNWCGSAGSTVKNVDMWIAIRDLLLEIGVERVVMQWTKGHLISSLTPRAVRITMDTEPTGGQLYSQLYNMASRISERSRIIKDFNDHRVRNSQFAMPDDMALDWTIMNVMADYIAGYVKERFN